MTDRQAKILKDNAPRDELEILIREATQAVEDDLALEDAGWISLSGVTGDVITSSERITNLKLSRLYATKDPMGKQAIRLWTDYTFGTGMTWSVPEENEATKKVLESFWEDKDNQAILGARGQRKSSDKLLIDGEVFFAIFLGTKDSSTIRWIDPLEITEIITDPDDKENVKFYRRQWTDTQGTPHTDIYRSTTNQKDEAVKDSLGASVQKTEDALIYHLTYNTITQRGNPLLLPALIWMKYHTKFLGSRIAVMLALAKFAWKSKVKGGQTAVDAIKAKTHQQTIAAGSHLAENLGVDTTPIKTETGASGAKQDGDMIKLMIASATGLPLQYFGDISIGNWATAKTVELPMMKMFQSYQKVWADTYQDIDEVILEHANISPDKWYIDRDFPKIAPADILQAATALVQILQVMPELGVLDDVKQIALMTLGVNDTADVLDELNKEPESNREVALIKALKQFRESLSKKE
ncbi:MAG: hypothetical protein KAS32_21025 [Candidatus Peribacteraceae bacterium]|nr:hypothetical protein [Candidatus Peribacteraceae bacterium]